MAVDLSETLSKSAMVSELEAAGARFKGLTCNCPFHEDKNPSASIHQGTDSVWRFKCFSGPCTPKAMSVFDVRAKRTGKDLKDIIPHTPDGDNGHRQQAPKAPTQPTEPKKEKARSKVYPTAKECIDAAKAFTVSKGGKVEEIYSYTDAAGTIMLVVMRTRNSEGKKAFLQFSAHEDGWALKGMDAPRPLYRLPVVIEAGTVFVVEGEKCVRAIEKAGFVGTTNAGGAQSAKTTDWTPLAGKTVFLWPDNDKPGIAHMEGVRDMLLAMTPAARCLWIDPETVPGLEEKGDVADLLEHVSEREECAAVLQTIMDNARAIGPYSDLCGRIDAIIAGTISAVHWPHANIGKLTQALLPGTVTILGGNAGSSKSFFVLECLAFWHGHGTPVGMFALEDDTTYHLQRVLAQLSGVGDITNLSWVRSNGREAKDILKENKAMIEGVGSRITEATDKAVNFEQAAQWVERQAAAGSRVIIIDPVSVLSATTDRSFREEQDFMNRVKQAVKKSGASLLMVMHGKKGKNDNGGYPSLDEFAGGAAYTRLAHTVLWLHFYPEDTAAKVQGPAKGSTLPCMVNRHVFIAKARNGTGTGRAVGFQFSKDSLRMEEQGILCGRPKSAAKDEEEYGRNARDIIDRARKA